ncbi:hypothetical protein NQ317_004107 [Molorchus minor]|uniref:Glutamate decarboxylase n=1 Tax=Molorchus minor TaxID=1323400 RepID=A0ABQ9JCU5_9CUCU|nr:hypothetical protein NQ317_004107 [Molorchus minor]
MTAVIHEGDVCDTSRKRGTTVRGAFDPILEIADICKKHNIWLHIDAAWGGGIIFSQKHRAKLNGIERANSIVINPHKLLAVPQQCSMLLVKDKDILHECFSSGAEYLFQKDKHYDKKYDLGDAAGNVTCSSSWLMWKAKGSSGFASHIDTLMDLAEYFEQQVNNRPDFMMVSRRQYMNVCFWYLPRYLRGKTNIFGARPSAAEAFLMNPFELLNNIFDYLPSLSLFIIPFCFIPTFTIKIFKAASDRFTIKHHP